MNGGPELCRIVYMPSVELCLHVHVPTSVWCHGTIVQLRLHVHVVPIPNRVWCHAIAFKFAMTAGIVYVEIHTLRIHGVLGPLRITVCKECATGGIACSNPKRLANVAWRVKWRI